MSTSYLLLLKFSIEKANTVTTLTPALKLASRIYTSIPRAVEAIRAMYLLERLCTRVMALCGIDPIRTCVASIAVHDDGNVLGHGAATDGRNQRILQPFHSRLQWRETTNVSHCHIRVVLEGRYSHSHCHVAPMVEMDGVAMTLSSRRMLGLKKFNFGWGTAKAGRQRNYAIFMRSSPLVNFSNFATEFPLGKPEWNPAEHLVSLKLSGRVTMQTNLKKLSLPRRAIGQHGLAPAHLASKEIGRLYNSGHREDPT
jgi:hypothetical protein